MALRSGPVARKAGRHVPAPELPPRRSGSAGYTSPTSSCGRLVAHGHGFHPFGQPTRDEMAPIRDALHSAGRSMDELEVVGGVRPRFSDARSPADLDEAAESIPAQLAEGYTAISFNPSQYTDDAGTVPALCPR